MSDTTTTPKAPKKAATPETPKAPTLAPAQKAAEANMIRLAVAADSSFRHAAEAIAECAALGIHRAYGKELAAYVTDTLMAQGIARSTVYFLKDVGVATAALGKTVANAVPMDALRELASAAKADPEVIRDKFAAVVPSGKAGKVTTEDVRKVTRSSAEMAEKKDEELAAILSKKAVSYADGDDAKAIRILTLAVERLQRIAKKAAEVESTKAKKKA